MARLPTGGAATVASIPFTFRVTKPVTAPIGTVTVMEVAVAAVTVPSVPLNNTTLSVLVALKLVPVRVTASPGWPLVGAIPVILGAAATTVNVLFTPAPTVAALPNTVTTTAPVVAPAGMVTVICVAVAAVTVATTPLILTTSLPMVVLKLVPVMINTSPVLPLDADIPVKVGGNT